MQSTSAIKAPARKTSRRGSTAPEPASAATRPAAKPAPPPHGKALAEDRFVAIGAYGFRNVQIALLAALVTADPLLLIGRCGTGKTFLLNSISEALGLEHRHYNASLIAFDDLVGFPYPDDARESVRFLQTPATIWGAESVLVDEISRCKPEHQNRLFSLVHERRIQGIALERLRYRWAAMNPASADQQAGGEYLGSEPLDPALADRFALIVEVGDWAELDESQQRLIASPVGEGLLADDGGRLRADVARWRTAFDQALVRCPPPIVEYARLVTCELGNAGIRLSPRRARLLARSLLAACVIEGGAVERSFRTILECSLPQRASGEAPAAQKIAAAHRLAWDGSLAAGVERWLCNFHLERTLAGKVRTLVETCPGPDAGTLAVEQLLAHEQRARVAAFAFALYPAALAGRVPIGAEGVADLGRLAGELLTVDGEIRWQERFDKKDTAHPELARLSAVLTGLEHSPRRARAEQLFYWAILKDVPIEQPEALEAELHAAVEYLAGRA